VPRPAANIIASIFQGVLFGFLYFVFYANVVDGL
jgi:hypothetical protein